MRLPFVVSVPHCSVVIPEDLFPSIALTEREILEFADIGAREAFAHLPVRVVLWSRWHRIMADLNRDHRQRNALGVVPQMDYHGRKIYLDGRQPTEEDVEIRLKTYYWPYHNRLREALDDPAVKALFDCHSLTRIGPPGVPDPLKWRKDIVLGNNGDQRGEKDPSKGELTCPPDVIRMIGEVFDASGFSVSINRPYSGGYITTYYGQKLVKKGKMALQIELNQDLYLDGEALRLQQDRLSDIAVRLQNIFREIARRL